MSPPWSVLRTSLHVFQASGASYKPSRGLCISLDSHCEVKLSHSCRETATLKEIVIFHGFQKQISCNEARADDKTRQRDAAAPSRSQKPQKKTGRGSKTMACCRGTEPGRCCCCCNSGRFFRSGAASIVRVNVKELPAVGDVLSL